MVLPKGLIEKLKAIQLFSIVLIFMRNIFLCFVLLLCVSGMAQQNKVGVTFLPGFSYRVYQSDDPMYSSEPIPTEPKPAFSAGAYFEHLFHPKVSFFAGLIYINNGYQTQETDVLYSNISRPPYKSFRSRLTFHQISIPVGVNYFIPIRRIKLFLQAGVAAHYLVGTTHKMILYDTQGGREVNTTKQGTDGFNRLTFSARAAFGIEFGLGDLCTMRVFPTIQYAFTNTMPSDIPYKIYLNSSAIGLGVYRTL